MLASLANFVLVRPLVCLLILMAMYGWGWIIRSKHQSEPHLHFSNGFYLSIITIFVLGCTGLANIYSISLYLCIGAIATSIDWIKSEQKFQYISFKPNLYWLMLPLLGIMYIRCSAPPYFIDFLQYHLPYCYEFINHGGFEPLPHFFFASTASNFGGESLFIFPLIISQPETAVLFNAFLGLVTLVHLKKLLSVYQVDTLVTTIIIFILFSCEIFFHNSVYGKTENLILFIVLDILLRLKLNPFQSPYGQFSIGLALSFLPFFKLSMSLVFIPLLIWALWNAKQLNKLNTKSFVLMFVGGLVPLILLMSKNIIHHGMPLYPLIYNVDILPTFFEKGPTASLQASELDLSKTPKSFINLFKGKFTYGFSPSYLAWFLSLGCLLCLLKKSYGYLLVFGLILVHWQYWVLTFIYDHSAFRLTFPSWVIALVFFGVILSKYKSKGLHYTLLAASFICYGLLILNHMKFLPGLKYQLGRQNVPTYYTNLNTPIGAIDQTLFENLPEGKRIAMNSEFAGAFYHPKLCYVNFSNVFDKTPFTSIEAFMQAVHKENFHFIIADKTLISGLASWSAKAAAESKLNIIHSQNDITIYEISR